MVGTRLPEGALAAHPVDAGEDIHERVLESVPHVQGAGDVGRRQHDAVGCAVAFRLEQAMGFPARVALGFDFGGGEGAVQSVSHNRVYYSISEVLI